MAVRRDEMKHISDNIKMNNLLLVLSEKEHMLDSKEDNDSHIEWISKYIIESLTTLWLTIVIAFFSSEIANIIGRKSDEMEFIPIVVGLIVAAIILIRHSKKSKEKLTIKFNDGKIDKSKTESASMYLEKNVFPGLVVAEECFETVEANKINENCSGLNVIWGEISLRKSINSLYNYAESFQKEYRENGQYGGLTQKEIDQVFAVVNKIISKLENLELQDDSNTDCGADLRMILKSASIKIREQY